MIRIEIFTIIILISASTCANAQPELNCDAHVMELEEYMLNDIKSIHPSENIFLWASGVSDLKITKGRRIMERMKECSSASNSSYEFRSLQTTYNIMLFYLNQIAEMSWYRKLFAPLFFKEEVFIRDYNEIMDGIAVLKSGRQEK